MQESLLHGKVGFSSEIEKRSCDASKPPLLNLRGTHTSTLWCARVSILENLFYVKL